MNFCENCGNKISPDEKFCGECGAKIVDDPQTQKGITTSYKSYTIKDKTNIHFLKIEWDKRTKIIVSVIAAMVILLFAGSIIGKTITGRDKIIKEFSQAVTDKNAKKMAKLMTSADSSLKIDENTLKPVLDYAEKNPSWLQSVINKAQSQSKTEKATTKTTNDDLFSNGDITLKKDGKTLLFFDKYVFEVKPYFVNITTNLKNTEILINDTSVGTSDKENFSKQFGPYLPGVYKLKAVYKGDYTTLETSSDIQLIGSGGLGSKERAVPANLNINARFISVSSNYPEARLIANGKDTGVLVKDAKRFGPVDEKVKLSAKADFPWGEMSSNETTADKSGNLQLNISGLNDELKGSLMESIKAYNQSWIQAVTERDSSKFVNLTSDRMTYETKYLEDMKKADKYFKGKITKVVFDLDSMKVEKKDGKYYASVNDSEYYDSAYYYKNNTNAVTTTNNPKWRYSLLYDETNKKWLINGADSLWFSSFSNNTKEITF